MQHLRRLAARRLAAGTPAIVVTVELALGSAPREAGTRMLVDAGGVHGTIGGGHLELKAIAEAQAMLSEAQAMAGKARTHGAASAAPRRRHYPLGPALGQCCGGAVTLGYALLDAAALAAWPEPEPRFFLQLYGAGHVGRAIARALAPLDVRVDWIDEREDQFPVHFFEESDAPWPAHMRKVCVDAVEGEVEQAPPGAFYLVLTHRHDLDLRIAMAILERGDFGYCGLIGSKTKRARFRHRFEVRGIAAESIDRLVCPIGVDGIDGKEPEVIAAAVVAQLLQASSSRRSASTGHAACREGSGTAPEHTGGRDGKEDIARREDGAPQVVAARHRDE